MDIRFPLKIEVKIKQGRRYLINQTLKNTKIHIPLVPRKHVHSAGTLRAMQVAAIGRLD
jgi:hypothetical protein